MDGKLNRCLRVNWSSPGSDHSNANSGRQACKKHELYVSFSDLGWKVGLIIIIKLYFT